MKNRLIISSLIVHSLTFAQEEGKGLIEQLTTCVNEKCTFVQKHDTLNILPRIATICAQLQEICRESQTICKERRFALDRELAILVMLYFKQLPEEEVEELKNIIKKYHEIQRQVFASPTASQEYSQRQKHYIELILL